MTLADVEARIIACRRDYADAAARAISPRAREAGTTRLWASLARLTARQGRDWQRLWWRLTAV